MIHLRIPYYRPSWQGGDTIQPLCRKPRYGWCGDDSEPMSSSREEVSCQLCQIILKRMDRRGATAAEVQKPGSDVLTFSTPKPRKNDDLKHCRAVWEASRGMMFPFGISPHLQRGAA